MRRRKLETVRFAMQETREVSDTDMVRDNLTGGMMTRRTFHERFRVIREELSRHVPEGVSIVDELIAERRAEAARENAEWNP